MASPRVFGFALYSNIDGSPLAGQTPTFLVYCDETGTDITPPSIIEVKGGMYYFVPTFRTNHALVFLIDGGVNALSRYDSQVMRPEDYDVDLIAPIDTAVAGASAAATIAATQATLARKFLQNNKIVDPATNQEQVLDDDDSTILQAYALQTDTGSPTTGPNIFKKLKV